MSHNPSNVSCLPKIWILFLGILGINSLITLPAFAELQIQKRGVPTTYPPSIQTYPSRTGIHQSEQYVTSPATGIIQPGTTINNPVIIINTPGVYQTPQGIVVNPDGTLIYPDGTIYRPNGTVITTNGTIINNHDRHLCSPRLPGTAVRYNGSCTPIPGAGEAVKGF